MTELLEPRLLDAADLTSRRPFDSVAAQAAASELDGATALEILTWVNDRFPSWAVASSMTDAVVIHLASQIRPGVDVLFLDTGYHFAETRGTADAVEFTYPITLRRIGSEQSVAEQDRTEGKDLFAHNPDRCCALRKKRPLDRALRQYPVWVTGARRADGPTRADTQVIEWDDRRGMARVNPLTHWSDEQVDAYIAEHGILTNPLLQLGYPSIGCEPCTRPVAEGEDARAGRWAGLSKTECGILI